MRFFHESMSEPFHYTLDFKQNPSVITIKPFNLVYFNWHNYFNQFSLLQIFTHYSEYYLFRNSDRDHVPHGKYQFKYSYS